MNKSQVVAKVLGSRQGALAQSAQGQAYASTNIALCKYWGKRDKEINLPLTSSLSLSLREKGSTCTLWLLPAEQDSYRLNGEEMPQASAFSQRLKAYLDLFRPRTSLAFEVKMEMNIPMAAGLASSACGFASLVLALNDYFSWKLEPRELSILARLGSGSASRSIEEGFVEWHAGLAQDGMDSFSERLPYAWPELNIGLVLVNKGEKPLSSRLAMERTVATSALYPLWPAKVAEDLPFIKEALQNKDFELLGQRAESNALTMHALMLSAWPPISYAQEETFVAMRKVWALRQQGLALYFTQDAGPNLKLLFCDKDRAEVLEHFSGLEVVKV